MKCIFCGYEESKVLDSRDTNGNLSIRRRRECLNCGKRYTTYETIDRVPVLIIKKDHSRQPFDIEKLKNSIMIACDKRPVSADTINSLAKDIEKEIYNAQDQEINSSTVGEMALRRLRKVDELAYVRYAIVFKKFEDIKELATFISNY